jgi:integrase
MAGCTGLRFAELRHTAVTRLHEAGATETYISGITGHSPKTVREIIDRHYVVRTEKAAVFAFRQRLEAEKEEDGNTRSGQF